MRLGNEAILTQTRKILRQANHVFYAKQRQKKLAQLNKLMFSYFNQPITQWAYNVPQWHRVLADQLVENTIFQIRPGMVDSKGWLSAIVETPTSSLTFLLFEEHDELGMVTAPIEVHIHLGRPISYGS